ncbi:hypothetical protein PCANC_16728 [Puccinia coronata f. sp. avenae]|uniref:Putative 5'-nucleotidase C-terminal domain-containing protein n=1 Tax=Puccinia coronata f. sp. avenae TaxID=200324 RepID=A0A2N5U0Y8_9BASI|nr:hypothetical protein PCANC_16728 [Puccinia coronata f. sp. avenae]
MDDDLSAQVDRTTLEAVALEPTIPQFKHSQECENLRKQFPPTNIFKKTGDMNTYPAHLLINLAVLILVNPFVCSACDGHHLHTRSQPHSTQPLDAPTRQLEWGDLNIIHTTDTHGWLLGHLKSESPEPNYSGDFGDFQSFVLRMKQKAKSRKVDLLIVDTGDLHDGNGLSDAEPLVHPGVPRGTTSGKFFAGVPYDILAIGNHELYDLTIAQSMHDNFAPVWKGSYLTSNANITTSGRSVPIGSRYRKFKTEQGRRVTAFGIIFDFTGNANGTIVQPPAQLVLEPWFKEAIRERPDVFLLAGHMGITDADWKIVFSTVRQLHPNVPIIILGGHLHIRDCMQLDDRSMSLASGRYMETIGWLSVKNMGDESKPEFSRRYLDPNRLTYAFHAGEKFDTQEGLNTTHGLTKAAADFNITYEYGVVPQSFFGYRVAPTAKNSLNYLFTGPGGVLESVIKNPARPHPPFIVINTGALRFDVLAGNFTANDQLITMPFANDFVYVPDVPRPIAEKLLDAINQGGAARNRGGSRRVRRNLERTDEVEKDEEYHLGQDVEDHYRRWLQLQSAHRRPAQSHLSKKEKEGENVLLERAIKKHQLPTFGYVTQDKCPGDGDDVIHQPLPSFDQPEYVATGLPPAADKFSLAALNTIASRSSGSRKYTPKDVLKYSDIKSSQVLGLYALQKWNSH